MRPALESSGFEIVPQVLSPSDVEDLRAAVPETYGSRSLLELSFVRDLAQSTAVRTLISSVLSSDCFSVRGLFFDKTESANWKVPWHQDRVIAVRERRDADGFLLWTNKSGILHVQPPADLLARMVAIRLHLDDSTDENGPLRVIPGSHRSGFISDAELEQWKARPVVTCTCKAGDAIVMRPLLLHASSPAIKPFPRRVIHSGIRSGAIASRLEMESHGLNRSRAPKARYMRSPARKGWVSFAKNASPEGATHLQKSTA